MSVAAASYSQHSTSRGTEARRSHYRIGPISTGPQRRSRSFRSSRRRRTGRLPTYDRVARRCGAAAEPRRARGADARDDAARAARPPHQDSFATRILSRGVPKLAGVPPPGGLATHRSLTMRCAIRLFMLVCPASACKTGGRSDGMPEGPTSFVDRASSRLRRLHGVATGAPRPPTFCSRIPTGVPKPRAKRVGFRNCVASARLVAHQLDLGRSCVGRLITGRPA
jgi:hypothetical protein